VGKVDPGLRCSPGCIDSHGKGWVLTVGKERVRVLGRTAPGWWRVQRIDARGTPVLDLAESTPGLALMVASLRKRGVIEAASRSIDLFGREIVIGR